MKLFEWKNSCSGLKHGNRTEEMSRDYAIHTNTVAGSKHPPTKQMPDCPHPENSQESRFQNICNNLFQGFTLQIQALEAGVPLQSRACPHGEQLFSRHRLVTPTYQLNQVYISTRPSSWKPTHKVATTTSFSVFFSVLPLISVNKRHYRRKGIKKENNVYAEVVLTAFYILC